MRFVLHFIKQGFPRNNDFTMLNIAAEEFRPGGRNGGCA